MYAVIAKVAVQDATVITGVLLIHYALALHYLIMVAYIFS